MAILHAIILGIIEGLTEFLPISSTGHLIVAEHLIGFKDTAELFTVVVQLGAIAAVMWHFRQRLIELTSGIFKGQSKSLKFLKIWILATIPAAVVGLLASSWFDTLAKPGVVELTLIIGGLLILLIEKTHAKKSTGAEPKLEEISTTQSINIGLYQVVALIPGVSRSGATIMGGLMSGLDRVTATAFSFYLSMPILILAGVYKLVKNGDQISSISGGAAGLITGIVAAFLTALMVVKWLLKYVSGHDFKIFAYYRIFLGIAILVCYALF